MINYEFWAYFFLTCSIFSFVMLVVAAAWFPYIKNERFRWWWGMAWFRCLVACLLVETFVIGAMSSACYFRNLPIWHKAAYYGESKHLPE